MRKIFARLRNIPTIQKLIQKDRELSSKLANYIESHKKLFLFFNWFRVITNLVGIPLYLYLLFTRVQTLLDFFIIIIFWLISGIVIELGIKRIFARLRPFAKTNITKLWRLQVKKPTGYSFPSGHGFHTGFMITLAIILHLPLWPVVVLIALLVAISRVALGFHYFSDVITGFILGILATLAMFTL